MLLLADLPFFILDQILGNESTSYTSIKLWQCGSKLLNAKLCRGLTFLKLKAHKLCLSVQVPRMIFALESLRHLDIDAGSCSLVPSRNFWPSLITRLPKTLETLILEQPQGLRYCFMNYPAPSTTEGLTTLGAILPSPIITNYPRGASPAIDLEKCFPRLRRLELRFLPRRALLLRFAAIIA